MSSTSHTYVQDSDVTEHVKRWLDTFVIELELCPFAKRERVNDTIRFVVSNTDSESGLLGVLAWELDHLTTHPDTATTLLIHPGVLKGFSDYNQFLNQTDALLEELELEGTFQIASFHPDYQFADTQPDDAENYTNRAPYPLLHILREASVERAVERHPDADGIPEANLARLRAMGVESLQELLRGIAK